MKEKNGGRAQEESKEDEGWGQGRSVCI